MMLRNIIFISLVASSLAAKFPDSFLFGAGGAAFQIEGAWDEDGKGPSIWDTYLHKMNASQNGDVACDSYHKWQDDIENAKQLGLNFYRFSISWPRILPNGTLWNINQKGVDYYLNLIKGLKALGIEPVITLYHWDMPQHIYENGGFLNPQFVDYFEDFARLCYQLYGPYVKYWLTINEPTSVCNAGYALGLLLPGLKLIGDGTYQCSYVLLKAHARAYRIYDEEFKPKYGGKVSLVFDLLWIEPESNSTQNLETQERALQFTGGIYAHPIYKGNWPQVIIDRVANRSKLEGLARSRLPQFTQEEIDYINGTHDFFALNHYHTFIVEDVDFPISNPSLLFDAGANIGGVKDYPAGLRKILNFINDRYQPSGILITENGWSTNDTIKDVERINSLRDFLSNVLDTIVEDNVNVFGYSVWSLIDNFEWGSYESRYGLIRVDFDSPNRTRNWKDSATWYQQVISTRSLDN